MLDTHKSIGMKYISVIVRFDANIVISTNFSISTQYVEVPYSFQRAKQITIHPYITIIKFKRS